MIGQTENLSEKKNTKTLNLLLCTDRISYKCPKLCTEIEHESGQQLPKN